MFATGSGAGLEAIEALGAVAIDHTSKTLARHLDELTQGEGFDVVLDSVGGATLDASFDAVRTYTGHVVSILGWGTHSLAPLSFRGATCSGVFTLLPLLTGRGREHHGQILEHVAALADAGALSPRLDPRTFDLTSVGEAHRAVEEGRTRGKVVVDVLV